MSPEVQDGLPEQGWVEDGRGWGGLLLRVTTRPQGEAGCFGSRNNRSTKRSVKKSQLQSNCFTFGNRYVLVVGQDLFAKANDFEKTPHIP